MIDKEGVLSKIHDLLKELTLRYEHIAEEENINSLEYELFEIDAHHFAKYAEILRKLLVNNTSDVETSLGSSEVYFKQNIKEEEVGILGQEDASSMEYNTFSTQDSSKKLDIHEYEVEVEQPILSELEEVSTDDELKESISGVGESSYNSQEKENGTFERELIYKDEVIGEEDEVVLGIEEVNPSLENLPPVNNSSTREVTIEEKEFSFKLEAQPKEETDSVETFSPEIKQPVSNSLSDIYSSSQPQSINERISALKQSSALGANSKSFPFQGVSDIKSIINLNDKLLFIKDLFNGYSLAYSEAIELLNRFDNFNDADQFLKNNYAEKNNWQNKKDTVEKLYIILNKRFHSK